MYNNINRIRKQKNNLRMRLKEYKTKNIKVEYGLKDRMNDILDMLNIERNS